MTAAASSTTPSRISTGFGIPRTGRPVPRAAKFASVTVAPPARTSVRPRSTASIPRVVISAFTLTTVTSRPLTMPIASPVASAASTPTNSGWFCATVAITTPHTAAPLPTDRSTWPAISNMVPGTAMMPVTAMAVSTLRTLFSVRKYGDVTEKKMMSPTSTTSSAATSGSERLRAAGAAAGLGAVDVLLWVTPVIVSSGFFAEPVIRRPHR